MTELGGRIYELSAKKKNPMLDLKVNTITRRIKTCEDKIARLEETIKKTKRFSQSNTDKHKSPQKKPKK
ncbi:MAG: hypothetical protein P8X47_13345 [Ignavibacteriaceae bacterium]